MNSILHIFKRKIFIFMTRPKKATILLLLLSLIPMVNSCAGMNMSLGKNSFGMLKVTTVFTLGMCLDTPEVCNDTRILESDLTSDIVSTGSAVIVDHKLRPPRTYMLSAWHVCDGIELNTVRLYGVTFAIKESSINIRALLPNGTVHNARVIKKDVDSDLCLLEIEGRVGKKVRLAKNALEYGEPIFNFAAPYGIFNRDMVMIFEGRYTGDLHGSHFFNFPARPGSSGSPVLNESGELVSIIHSASTLMESVAIGTKYKMLRSFLRE